MKSVMKSDEYQLVIKQEFSRNDSFNPVFHALTQPNLRAQLAEKLVNHFGVIAAEPDGVDDIGRQKGRLMSPLDVVLRACDIANLFYNEAESRGWMIPVPSMEEIQRAHLDDSDKD